MPNSISVLKSTSYKSLISTCKNLDVITIEKEKFQSYESFVNYYLPQIKLHKLTDNQHHYLHACFISVKYGFYTWLPVTFKMLPPKEADFTATNQFIKNWLDSKKQKLSTDEAYDLSKIIQKVSFQFEHGWWDYIFVANSKRYVHHVKILRYFFLKNKENFNEKLQYARKNHYDLIEFYNYFLKQIIDFPNDYKASWFHIFKNKQKYPKMLNIEKVTAIYQFYKNMGYNQEIIEAIISHKYPYYAISLVQHLLKESYYCCNGKVYSLSEYYLHHLAKFPYQYSHDDINYNNYSFNYENILIFKELIENINHFQVEHKIELSPVIIKPKYPLKTDIHILRKTYQLLRNG